MNITEVETKEELARAAADLIAAQIKEKPDSVLGLATGSTPLETYALLAKLCAEGKLDFSRVRTFNLDEYAGLDGSDPHSYTYFMNENLFSKINIKKENVHIPNGAAADLALECENYDKLIEKNGGIDLQLLGLGYDGHIGFNEPGDGFIKKTHTVTLDRSTIDANSRFFAGADEVPKTALTMGIKPIMNAKKILLIISGADKKEMLQKALYGPVTPRVPASVLQRHKDLTVIYTNEGSLILKGR